MSAIFLFSVFEESSFFQRKCWRIVPSDLIVLSGKNKWTYQKSETLFSSRTCQEANAMFIVLFRSFLAGLEFNLHRHMLSQKNVSITLSLTILRFFKEWAIMYRSNRSLNIPPPGIPRAFDVFSCPGGREFDELSLPRGGHLITITTHWGWGIRSLVSISCYESCWFHEGW